MSARIDGGINIAMKVPPHRYAATLRFYLEVIGLKPVDDKAPASNHTHL